MDEQYGPVWDPGAGLLHAFWVLLRVQHAGQRDAIEVLSRSPVHVEIVARAEIDLALLDRQRQDIEQRMNARPGRVA